MDDHEHSMQSSYSVTDMEKEMEDLKRFSYSTKFSEDINSQMQIPDKISMTGDEGGDVDFFTHTSTSASGMQVPDRIMIGGQTPVGLTTPPRVITLEDHPFPTVNGEVDDVISEEQEIKRKPLRVSVNNDHKRPSSQLADNYIADDQQYLSMDAEDDEIIEEPVGEDLQTLRYQVAKLSRRCNPGWASYLLCEHVFNGQQKIMVLGGGCSVATAQIAAFSHLFNLIQVSYSAASPQLSNKSEYPLFLRTQQSDLAQNIGRIAILKHFGWKRVATLYQNEKFFVMVIDDMIVKMRENDINLLASLSFNYHPSADLDILKVNGDLIAKLADNDVQLVTSQSIVLAPVAALRKIKEEDARIIVVHSYEDHARALFCEAYRQGMYGATYAWLIPGWYSDDWWKTEDSHINCTLDEMKKVLESVIETVQDSKGPDNVTNINGETYAEYEERYLNILSSRPEYKWVIPHMWHGLGYDAVWSMALALNASIDEVALGGRVWFNEHGDRIGRMAIYQILGDAPPVDEQRWTYEVISINETLSITVSILACLGIVMAAVFLGINIIYRDHGFIKLSSPRMNNIILSGAILVYLSIMPLGMTQSPFELSEYMRTISCIVGKWLLSVGFTLSFGSMFAKTWRVHRIFTNMKPNTTIAQDNTKTLYQTNSCSSQYVWYWLGALYGLKGLLLLFGCFLAHETRNIQVEGLNDSRQIGVSVYNIMVSCLVGVTLTLALENNPTLSFAFTSFPIFLCTSITIVMMFIPKIRVIVKDPKGGDYLRKRTREGLTVSSTMSDLNQQCAIAKSESKTTLHTNME
uniref:Gamma-aminobutyric acid type B receptor subunit 1-like n=1 Tax=Saccoglossus kowalevskii TaxID=10224 RepID=A0ABM0MGV5_SACKO|nr:PREDICTED: gamma-aminobutyric acid type B receptor subunit 1-like [Saccoglossus kowalevskii]